MTKRHREPVDLVTTETLTQLLHVSGPCVSIYLPTARALPEANIAPKRLRALVEQARSRLAEDGVPQSTADAILAPVEQLMADLRAWHTMAEGLAVFAAPDHFSTVRTLTTYRESLHVGPAMHVTPLLEATEDRTFMVLALGRNNTRLFRGTSSQLIQVDLGAIPASLEAIERQALSEPQLQHQHQPRGTGVAAHHGHSAGKDNGTTQLEKFVLEVANGYRATVGASDTRPLVLAAVAEHLPLLRDTNLLPQLVDGVIRGNPEAMTARELHTAAVAVLEEHRAGTHPDLELLTARLGTGHATTQPEEVRRRAAEGALEALVIDPDADLDEATRTSLAELLRATLDASGRVSLAGPLPAGAPVGALLRW